MRYDRGMPEVASRALRNQTRALLDRVEAGESLTITVDGRAVAILGPVSRRASWMPRHEFTARILKYQADAGLGADIDEIAGDLTDDEPLS
jgi:prevent-host-death family protein